MTALKRNVLRYLSEECDPHLPALRAWFGLTESQSHALVKDLLGTGRDRIVSNLIPLVFDWLAEEERAKGRAFPEVRVSV